MKHSWLLLSCSTLSSPPALRSFPPTNTCLQTLDLGASWGDEGQGDKLREAINPILGGQEEVLEEVAPET